MCGITIAYHFTRMLAHHHGDLIKCVGTKGLIAGTAQLLTCHCFMEDEFNERYEVAFI
jgi:hypothetical protein